MALQATSTGRLRELELRHLHALVAVADEGSFGRAAARLAFTQSAVSQQIAALERVVGGKVFDRPGGPKPVELTPLGVMLVDHARHIQAQVAAAEEDLERLLSGGHGRLAVGTFQSVSVKLLPEILRRLRLVAPGAEVRIEEHDSDEELAEGLTAGRLDLSFLVGTHTVSGIESVALCEDPFVALIPRSEHPGGGPLPAQQLVGRAMIGQQPSSCQVLVDRGLGRLGVHPNYVFRSNDNGAVQAMVRAGMGVAVLPYLATDPDDGGVVIVELDPPLAPRVISLARRANRTLAPVAERFMALAIEVTAELTWPAPR
ncbi:MAG: LysR family transcriptional regulator [Acidimicrobiales bacterium]